MSIAVVEWRSCSKVEGLNMIRRLCIADALAVLVSSGHGTAFADSASTPSTGITITSAQSNDAVVGSRLQVAGTANPRDGSPVRW